MSLVEGIKDLAGAIRDKFNEVSGDISVTNAALSSKANAQHQHATSDTTSGIFSADRLPQASESAAGIAHRASIAETRSGTNTTKFVTPAGLTSWDALIRPVRKKVVFVGSSNTLPGTWPEKLMNLMGWTTDTGWSHVNRAIGGSGFTDGNWYNQIEAAYTDIGAAEASNVSYVFFGDSSNDVRSVINPSTYRGLVASALGRARTRFPNARVIIVPLIWPSNQWDYCPDAFNGFAYLWPSSIANCMERLQYEANANRCEFIEGSWTWMTGHPEFMSALKDVHPGATGYTEVARWVAAYLRGGGPQYARSANLLSTIITSSYYEFPNDVASFPPVSGYTEGWIAHVYGAINAKGATGAASDMVRLSGAMRPAFNQQIYAWRWGADEYQIPVTVWKDGTLRFNKSVAQTGTFYVGGSYRLN